MSVTGIILAAVIVGGTGLFIGVFLGVAGKKFAVEVDEREEAILGVLPGNNCGGCGYAGCSGLAAAIVKGEAEVGGCPVGGAPVAAKVGEIMGVAAGAQVLYYGQHDAGRRTESLFLWMSWRRKLCSGMSVRCDPHCKRCGSCR